jgi:O-antigen/teichoic acid export membrane protein
MMSINIKMFYKYLIPVILAVILGFPIVLLLFGISENYFELWAVFAILMAGFIIAAGYLPFQMVFNQIGKPEKQTLFIFTIFATLVIGNIVTIPLLGMYGAAVTTLFSYSMQIVYLKKLLRIEYIYV